MKLRSKHKIISITVTHAHILLNTGETTKVALNELSFKPKVNDIVEVYQNKDQIIVMKVREKRKQWIYTVIVTIVALVIGGTSLWFLNHRDDSTQVVKKHSSSQKNTSEFSYRSSSSTSSSSSSEAESPVIDTSAEALRDMENDGTLKTGQRYRFTAELFRQSEWADYSGHFKKLNPYYSIWVKASNAPISGIEIQIMKSLTTGWTEGMKITFTVKIMEDSEKFQFWVVTEAIPAPTPKLQQQESTPQPEIQGIDTNTILRGDYTSIAGVWQNASGQQIIFDNKGLVNLGTITSANAGGTNGIIGLQVGSNSSGGSIIIYPIGASIITRSGIDNSDKNQIRIMAVQSQPIDTSDVYYHISN